MVGRRADHKHTDPSSSNLKGGYTDSHRRHPDPDSPTCCRTTPAASAVALEGPTKCVACRMADRIPTAMEGTLWPDVVLVPRVEPRISTLHGLSWLRVFPSKQGQNWKAAAPWMMVELAEGPPNTSRTQLHDFEPTQHSNHKYGNSNGNPI